MKFKNVIKAIFFVSFFASTRLISSQLHYYPIIFVHGHSGKEKVENTWEFMANKLTQEEDYSYYGKIWEKSELPSNLSEKSMFLFGYYRRHSNESMGDTIGKIGGFPIERNEINSMIDLELEINTIFISGGLYFTWVEKNKKDYKKDYFDSNRFSYVDRLSIVVDKVLEATKSDKVILICHSMGGLVGRSYIRWGGGENKVYKILTVGTPNHGIRDDNRAALEKFGNPETWQFGGEYLEMSTRSNFRGKSYTDHLNEGWEDFCEKHGIRYATIAGNRDPWPIIDVGENSDGVIDRDSVKLEGAEFNGLSYTTHTGNLPFYVGAEENMLRSTYTSEIIKRWVFRDEVNIHARIDPIIGPSPFLNRFLLQYESADLSAVCATFKVFNLKEQCVLESTFPVYSGFHQKIFDLDSISVGAYIAYLTTYDMNGSLGTFKQKIAKGLTSRIVPDRPLLNFTQKPADNVSSDSVLFEVQSTYANTQISYKLDGDSSTSYLLNSNRITLHNLEEGLHRIYISAYTPHIGYDEEPLMYQWIVGPPVNLILKNTELLGNQTIFAEKTIRTEGSVIIKQDASVLFSAKDEIIFEPGFETEDGVLFETEIID